ncbi:TPA: hypothetical protein N5H07_005477 [Salmonella enterica subsp. enterica serovar Paratyphi B]|nr:hypothetical protein [Salmonella enterica subsp. enterica serovar Paratyphi B]
MKLVTAAVMAGIMACSLSAHAEPQIGGATDAPNKQEPTHMTGQIVIKDGFKSPSWAFTNKGDLYKPGTTYQSTNPFGYFTVSSLDNADYVAGDLTATDANHESFTGSASSGMATITLTPPSSSSRAQSSNAITGVKVGEKFYIGIYPKATITPVAGQTNISMDLTAYTR